MYTSNEAKSREFKDLLLFYEQSKETANSLVNLKPGRCNSFDFLTLEMISNDKVLRLRMELRIRSECFRPLIVIEEHD